MEARKPDDDEIFFSLYSSVGCGFHLASSPRSQMTKIGRRFEIILKCI